MAFLVLLLILLGIGYRATTAEDRARMVQAGVPYLWRARAAVLRTMQECQPFLQALRERTPWAVVTPTLAALNAAIFVCMLFSAGSFSEPQTIIGWGGNYGLRTTNWEWWRLFTALFVHAGLFHLLFNVAGLLQLGLVLERIVGRLAFASVYFGAGLVASVASLSSHPLIVSAGAGGAIFGIYGLVIAWTICSWLSKSPLKIPLPVLKMMAPAAGLFFLYHLGDGADFAANFTGFTAGFAFGVVLTMNIGDSKVPARRVLATSAAAVVISAVAAFPLRGLTDARPEIERVVAFENRTASAYDTASDRFRKGRVAVEVLTQLINKTIVPELEAARTRLKTLERVPPEHEPLVAGAEEYLRLRDESWRLRAEGLDKANMRTLQKADLKERESLEALKRIKPAEEPPAATPPTGTSEVTSRR